MSDEQTKAALERIDAALRRIEAAAVVSRPIAPSGELDALQARHEALKSEATSALQALESLISNESAR